MINNKCNKGKDNGDHIKPTVLAFVGIGSGSLALSGLWVFHRLVMFHLKPEKAGFVC